MDYYYNETNFENFLWIDIRNPNKETLDKIALDHNLELFQIKDSQQVGHLPKIEKLPNYDFLILRAFSSQPQNRITSINELSNKIAFFYNEKVLITTHSAYFTFLEDVPKHFKGPEHFMLYLIHKMLQTFEEPAQYLGDQIDEMEEAIFLRNYHKISLEDLYFNKSQTRITKKLLQITQSVIQQLEVSEENKMSYQDINDRLVRFNLMYDEVLESSNNLLNTYLSVSSQKSNDVMKLLTVFSAFFLPLTFIVGLYGMNFVNMPELEWQYGYPIVLVVMVIISIIIYFWFKRKRFL
ncbi:hypothetical protein NMK71_08135 [Weeksellaceae bacterium KMM 9713]|uniref:Magnesium transporter n=1 Tax=Profundicola chukchiensis TaxID=2961959 RepID=A0A9X4RW01_9FLAO|nr:CorA family divalent cation transporter [Profundicola chukchiensis]MDG4946380.1 hypothetical protein [Profundicola chukchiensis]